MNQIEFNLEAARAARDEGIRQVSSNNQYFLEQARGTARLICESKGTVTADDVRRSCPVQPENPNAYGAVFKSRDFEWTGEYKQSEMVQAHGRMQRVWRLR